MDIRAPLVGFIVITLILAGYFWKKGNTSVTTQTPDYPMPIIPPGPGIGPIKKIVIGKDTLRATPNPNDNLWNVLEVTKVFVYSGGRRLGRDDFSDIRFRSPPAINLPEVVDPAPNAFVSSRPNDRDPQLILVLRNPMMISRVEVLSRQDCCWERLSGAMIALVGEKNDMIRGEKLYGVKNLQAFNM